jgi:4-alpha-glucanotransferase
LFLNPLYIDLDAVPEFGGVTRSDLERTIARLRGADMVAYAAVAAAKLGALRSAYRNFATSGSAERRDAFERFRQERGATLAKFAAFEFLRRKLGIPWPQWPLPWRRPDGPAVADLQKTHASELGYFAFVQWLAHEQLERCQARARARGLSIGLYLDVAVGVRPDGFDAWCDQDAILPEMSVGAPPDLLNSAGQDWGLAAFNPAALEASGFEPYRRMLQQSMRYAGAIRIDHVLGLNRLFLVPAEASPADGLYVRYPLAALLAVTALASVEAGCVVIGEDLGTVPKGFRSTMRDWGLWGYQVMLFERSRGGEFRPASRYRKDAVVTFATHDLPTFVGWWEARDLEARQRLGLKAGETRRQRQSARRALRNALPMSAREQNDFAAVVKFLARAPSRLLMVSMEDLLGVADQVNMPGTVGAYPNWRRRLPVALEEFVNHERVSKVAGEMQSAGRSPAGHRETVGMPG